MQSWARKYRPCSYDEYIGDTLKEIVNKRFAGNALPNVILISGSRGSGKTSLAWLLSKEYNCLEKDETGHACNKCEFCEDINEHIKHAETGMEVNGVQEIDIAAEGRRANIDEFIEEALLPPVYPLKYKILIMDEFHMANKNVQNRLLKVMEEPPEHLVFILCTTNPEAILPTIRSRCQLTLEVQRADPELLKDKLIYIAQQEKLSISEEAVQLIIKKTDRIPREAIMLLESVAASNDNTVTVEGVYRQINSVDNASYIGFYTAANTSVEAILSFVYDIKKQCSDLTKFAEGLSSFTLDCIYAKYGYNLQENTEEFVHMVKQLFSMYTNKEIYKLLTILEDTLSKMYTTGQSELHLINLALKIGRTGTVSKEPAERSKDADIENKRAVSLYGEQQKMKTTAPESRAVSDTLGRTAQKVQPQTLEHTDADTAKLTAEEEELMKYFGSVTAAQ